MKHKRVLALLFVTAALCLLTPTSSALTSILSFPFKQIGQVLRALSLSGASWNAVAVALYAALCLLPILYLAVRMLRRSARWEDALLVLLSATLFAVLYMMVNPAEISRFFGVMGIAKTGMAMLGGVVYSIAIGYAVLRALRIFSQSGEGSLLRYLYILLSLCGALSVLAILGPGLRGWIGGIREFRHSNTDGGNLDVSYALLTLQYLVDVLPYALNIAIIFSGLTLIRELGAEPYCDATVSAARRLGRVCRASIVAIMLSQIAINVAQLVLGKLVRSSHYSFSVPLFTIAFALAALLLAKYFERGKEMKDEGDMFI